MLQGYLGEAYSHLTKFHEVSPQHYQLMSHACIQSSIISNNVEGWLGGVVNGATYPALLYEYIMSQFYPDKGESEVNPLIRYGFMLLLVVLMTLVNYRGLDFVGKASISIYIISMSAFLVMTAIGIPKGELTNNIMSER